MQLRTNQRIKVGYLALAVFLLSSIAPADVELVIDCDGTDPACLPGLVITHGNVLFDVPMAKVFGLDVDNSFAPLPDAERFPNDFRDTLAKDEFLAAPDEQRFARGILLSFGTFNNPDPANNPQTLARMVFRVPLRNTMGNPLGGPGPRRIVFQNGNNAAGARPGGGVGGGGKGRKTAYLQPQRVPHGLTAWAGWLRKKFAQPGEDEAALRTRVKMEIEIAKKGFKRENIDKYLKLVDDSKFNDPVENFVAELTNDNGRDFIDVEFVFLSSAAAFTGLAELLDDFTVAITNDFSLASTDPDNQPAGQRLIGSGTVDVGAGESISMGEGDPEVPETSKLDAIVDSPGKIMVQFKMAETLPDQEGATQYLDITPTANDPAGTFHLIPYDQAVGDTAADIAADLATAVNMTPFDGGFVYQAESQGNEVMITRIDGEPIENAMIRRTNESIALDENLTVRARVVQGCCWRCDGNTVICAAPVLQQDCADNWVANANCGTNACGTGKCNAGGPAASVWGLIGLGMLLLAGATIVFGRIRAVRRVAG